MTDKQINKWLRRQFSQVGWVLVIYYTIINALAMLAMFLDAVSQYLRNFSQGNFDLFVDVDAIAGNAWGYVAAIAAGFCILYAWKGPKYWHQKILVREKTMSAGIFFSVLSLCIGAQMVNTLWISLLEWIMNCFGKSVLTMLESVSGSSDTFSMFLYASILAPIAEEILFRGYVLRTLQPYGRRFAILCSAFLFGIFHGNLLQTPYAFLVGLVLGYVAIEYSLIWAVALHMFNNLVLADLLTRLMSGLPDFLFGAVNLILFGSFAVASGIILVVKRREIADHIQGEWIDRRCLKCFFRSAGVMVLTVIMVLNMLTLLFV